MDLVSVIVPVYNVEQYLRECLDSIAAQTYSNLEVILVNDGSKDNSGQICEEYAQKYSHFTVVHKKNAGLGMARNTGLEHVHGAYVTFVDSDDYIDPTLIELLLQELKKQNVDVCKGGFRRITNEKVVFQTVSYEDELFPGEEARKHLLPRMVGSSPEKKDSVEMCVCGALYNVTPIRESGLRFVSERELISEDIVFNMDYMQHAKGACTISYVGYNYRLNLHSLSKHFRKDRFSACMHFYRQMREKLTGYGYNISTIHRLQRITFVYVRGCIAQEKYSRSKASAQESFQRIKGICRDETLREILREYPVKKLAFPQKCFVKMLDWKWYPVLFLLARIGKL